MNITKRGVIWLGQTCNLKCYFCYFRDRIDNQNHPEHQFMKLEKAKKIVTILKEYYGNSALDIQGGEPTIYPHIFELISYCNKIGISPTLITNGIVLANEDIVKRYKEVNINDFLFSIHALGDKYDKIVGVKGAHIKQLKALENLKKYQIPIRFNCTMTKEAMGDMEEISKLAIQYGVKVVNFITFNPFADQQGNRDVSNVPKYSQLKEVLQNSIDMLEKNQIEVNVRYFPLCILDEEYRKNIYDAQQLPYDTHEWDYNSWTWTTRLNQRSNSPKIDKPVPILLYKISTYNGIDFSEFSEFGTTIHYHKEKTEEFLLKLFSAGIPKRLLYKNNAKLRVEKHSNYKKDKRCLECSLYDICDGFHGDYADVFGMDEVRPLRLDFSILDERYYIKNQKKYRG